MHWFFIALLGPIIYGVVNHIDKYLIEKYLKNGATGALIIFSALFGVLALPIAAYFHPAVLAIGVLPAAVLTINGMLAVLAILCYFYALQHDEVSYVVPFYQTIPIFGLILGYFVLGETISLAQVGAMGIIILGALVLSFEMSDGLRFKGRVVALMLLASFLYAINSVVFKLIAVDEGFWLSLFWAFVGNVLLGLLFFLFVRSYREQFLIMLRRNSRAIIGLNALIEALYMTAEAITGYASLLASIALILLVNSFQPLFTLIIGILLTLFFPHLGEESISRKHLFQKGLGIALMILGTYLIGF